MKTGEELKKNTAREELQKSITQGQKLARKIGQKKRARAANPSKWSNNPLLLANFGLSSKPLILFELFLLKPKRINLVFCKPVFNFTITFIGFD